MKGILTLLFSVTLLFGALAQPAILVAEDVDLGDSTVYNLDVSDDVHKWEAFTIEVLYENLTVNDTTAKVELYNTLNYDFTDATDLDTGDALVAADGAGGTGTIMKSATFSNQYLQFLRIVIDPDEDDSGNGTATIRIMPKYKAAYTAPD